MDNIKDASWCATCRQQGIICECPKSPCFGEQCGIIPGTGHTQESAAKNIIALE